ncbi:SH2 domain-containing protein 6 [Pantherophis guttatus]|uniref:SH2 domain-containing protein 6 n=2 Tax=Colubridae TaxID=8578 RepID=A0ABM3YTR1_PANGU|nr:SH2 domain-containing protein 6 [Pantherophis guttatus]
MVYWESIRTSCHFLGMFLQVQASPAEEEEEAQDTYEPPPREEPTKKTPVVPPQESEQGIYLDCPNVRRFSVPLGSLHAKPCLLLTKAGAEDSGDEGTINIKAIEEALKKGLMKPPQPPSLPSSARRVSLPASVFSGHPAKVAINNDLFLASKDDKEEPEDQPIYLECEATTGLAPCKGSTSSALDPLTCLLKQAKSKISSLGSQQGCPEDNTEGRRLKTDNLPEDPDMKNAPWYAGSCDRRTAEAALLQFNKNSAFMVRQSSHHSASQPFTLVVFYKNRVYNVPIHYQESSCQFALGKDPKRHELFDSVSSIIEKYSERPLVLIDGSTSAKEQTRLLFPVTP